METRANLVTVGLFVLAVIAAGFVSVYWLLRGSESGPRAELIIVFPGSVSGLVNGAAVSFNGIKVGQVTRLSFAPDDPTRVIAAVTIDASTPVKRDSRASLGYQGLTGVATVQIWGGSADSPPMIPIEPGKNTLYAERSSVQDIIEGAQRVLGKVDNAVSTIDKVVQDNAEPINRTLKNAETFSDALAKNSGNVERFMADVGKAADVLSKTSGKIETLVEDLDNVVKSIDPKQVSAIVDNVNKVSGDVAKASGEIDGVMKDARAAAGRLKTFSDDLNNALGDVRKLVTAVDPDKVRGIVNDVGDFSHRLSAQGGNIDEIVGRAKTISENLDKFSKDVSAKSETVTKIIDDAGKIAERLEVASRRVDGILAKVDGLVGSDEGKGLFAKGSDFLVEAKAAATSVREMADTFKERADQIAGGLNNFAGTGLREVRGFVAEGRRTLNSLDRTIDEIGRNPQRFLFGGKQGNVPEYAGSRR